MKHKTADLTDDLLDAAVALALGHRVQVSPDGPGYEVLDKHFGHLVEDADWSVSWASAGPIIERERIQLDNAKDSDAPASERRYFWMATIHSAFWEPRRADAHGVGATPLIAAMRAYVAFKLGDEVELP